MTESLLYGGLAAASVGSLGRYIPARPNHRWEHMSVLLATHDPCISAVVEDTLVASGFSLAIARTADAAAGLLKKGGFDSVILDIETIDPCELRISESPGRRGSHCSILMISGLNGSNESSYGHAVRADDYITSPFHPDVLLTRVRALARRDGAPVDPVLRFGNLEMDQVHSVVRHRGTPLRLTPPEFELLRELMKLDGKSAPRSHFVRRACGGKACENHLPIHVSHLRAKLAADSGPQLVSTDHGDGLKLAPVSVA